MQHLHTQSIYMQKIRYFLHVKPNKIANTSGYQYSQ